MKAFSFGNPIHHLQTIRNKPTNYPHQGRGRHHDQPPVHRHTSPPHHRPHHGYGYGQSMVDLSTVMPQLRKLFSNEQQLEWAIDQALMDGPPPKQVRAAVLLAMVGRIMDQLPEISHTTPGVELHGRSPHNYGFRYPIEMPKSVLELLNDRDQGVEWIAEGPGHDVVADLLLMHLLESINQVISSMKRTEND